MVEIYYKGNTKLLKEHNLVSVAGSRKISKESIKWLDKAFKKLPSDTIIVSGLALGTDTIAHQKAIQYGLKTIAVLPSGFNNITPVKNRELANEIVNNDGLLISEYPPNMGIQSNYQYIERNKIIAKIGRYLIMPQCNTRSGTMATVDFTQELNKAIILPDHRYSGNQYIINHDRYISVLF